MNRLVPRPVRSTGLLRLLIVGLLLALVLSPLAVLPALATPPALSPHVAGELIVGYKAGVGQVEQAANAKRHGDEKARHFESINAQLVKLAKGKSVDKAMQEYRADPAVVYAEPNYIVSLVATPNDDYYSSLWGLTKIQADKAWDVSTGGASVIVGIVDTGVDYTHPDLAANIWNNPGVAGCTAGTHGYNAITRTCDPMDDHDHGSHTAGTIGAAGNNWIGVTGINWTAQIMGLKFLGSNGSGNTADAITAIDFAVQAKIKGQNVRVLNNSWGGGGFSQGLLDEINKAGASGILFVAAAGNNGVNNDTSAFYPCNYTAANLICVAATDENDALASFSNYGARSVHLAAPGVSILSTIRGGGYASYSGTSMATPHVSGAAALILSASGQPGLTVAQLKSAILNNVDPIPGLAGKTISGGRLNVCRAMPGCGAPPPSPTVPGAPTLSAGAGNAVVNLSWTAPANGGANITNYKVYRGTSAGGETLLTTLGTATTYADRAVTNGTTYFYRVSAVNSVGEGGASNEVSARPQAPQPITVPGAPQTLSAAPANGKGVQLTWTAPASNGGSAVTNYQVLRGEVSGSEKPLITVGNVTTYKDTSAKRGTRYYYKVAAINAAGTGLPSAEASAIAK